MSRALHTGIPAPDLPFRRVLHRRLLRWYHREGRELPWRGHDDPYAIMVSEFMLQQTQVARVREHLPRWLDRFPTVDALASASRRDVLLAWSGMGYNRRALHLHAAAQAIMREHDGRIPDDPALLQRLPGFGPYTAHAVACFGHRRRLPMVDVNIRRVLSRITTDMESETRMLPERTAWDLAASLLPPRAFYDWNQALMDLGAMICTARRPQCADCPVTTLCASSKRLRPDTRRRAAAAAIAPEEESGRRQAHTSSFPGVLREVPRRIYRGRLIEFLRGRRGHCATADTVHHHLFGTDGEAERERLLDILDTLERDGMLRCHEGRKAVTRCRAFTPPLARLRVCLVE